MSLQENLRDLSTRDAHVRGLSRRLDAGKRRRDAQQKKLDQLTQQLSELTDEHKRAQAHVSTLEHDAAAGDAKTAKLRDQMNTVKTNKEYSALLVQVNVLKIEQSKIDDLVLEQLARLEEQKSHVAELTEKVAEQTKLVELSGREVEEARSEVGDQLDEVTKERDEAADKIPADTLALYRKLNADTDGEGVCNIEEQDRKRREYTCGGCYMALPIETVNATITKPDAVSPCPYCDRILMVSEDLRTGLAPSKK